MPLMSGFPVQISICQRAALSANWSRGEAKICGKEKIKKRLRQSSEGEKNWLRRYGRSTPTSLAASCTWQLWQSLEWPTLVLLQSRNSPGFQWKYHNGSYPTNSFSRSQGQETGWHDEWVSHPQPAQLPCHQGQIPPPHRASMMLGQSHRLLCFRLLHLLWTLHQVQLLLLHLHIHIPLTMLLLSQLDHFWM